MRKTTRLELGFVRTDALMDEVLMEILDHLGIVYREAGEGNFPLLISSTKPREISFDKSLIVAEDILPMDEVLNVLSGESSVEDRDCFELKINELENELLAHIRDSYLAEDLPLVRKWYWPNFSKACCVLTHDVDWLSYSPFHKVVYRSNPFPKFLKLVFKHLLLREDYGYNVPEIVEIEKSKGVKSTFFLKTNYDDFEKTCKARRLLRENSFEIGLHGTRDSHTVLGTLKDELRSLQEAIGSDIHGLRYHLLKFNPGLTWRLEEEAGLEYDLTFSNNEYFGFKSQLCYPYHPIDQSIGRRLNILEIPTAFMDWTALKRRFTIDDCQSILHKIMDAVEEYNGCFAVNFHNTYLNREMFKEIYDAFLWTMDKALDRGYWLASAYECSRWWRIRPSIKLEFKLEEEMIIGTSSLNNTPVVIDMTDGVTLALKVDDTFKIALK
ncbi:MAG: hypothetical protein QW566_09445 [Candidatus Jordarchaeales archaeon]